MRTVENGTQEYTKVECLDEPGPGGACHIYRINGLKNDEGHYLTFGGVKFQNGPVKEKGVNGCYNEDLIAIVIDRLEHFQKGDFSCEENHSDSAIACLREAMYWMKKCTRSRKDWGAEGTNNP